MSFYEKYVEDLKKRIGINEKALKISERGASMEREKREGYHLPFIRTQANDAILNVETSGAGNDGELLTFLIIDEYGLTMISKDDPDFERKVRDLLQSVSEKEDIYVYHKKFIMAYLNDYLTTPLLNVVDLREEIANHYPDSQMKDKSMIPVSWDTLIPKMVPEAWATGHDSEVKIHAIADGVRLLSLYTITKAGKVIDLNTAGKRKSDISINNNQVTLPDPSWSN